MGVGVNDVNVSQLQTSKTQVAAHEHETEKAEKSGRKIALEVCLAEI